MGFTGLWTGHVVIMETAVYDHFGERATCSVRCGVWRNERAGDLRGHGCPRGGHEANGARVMDGYQGAEPHPVRGTVLEDGT
jgi:hypothetical protein